VVVNTVPDVVLGTTPYTPTRPTLTTSAQPAKALGEPSASFQRGWLSQEEKDRRRRLNLCLYCGGDNHQISTYPLDANPHPPHPKA
jgi:hypothetical protein